MSLSERQIQIDMIVRAYVEGNEELLNVLAGVESGARDVRDAVLETNTGLQHLEVTNGEVAESAGRVRQGFTAGGAAAEAQTISVGSLSKAYRTLMREAGLIFVLYQVGSKIIEFVSEKLGEQKEAADRAAKSNLFVTDAYDQEKQRAEELARTVDYSLIPAETRHLQLQNELLEQTVDVGEAQLDLIAIMQKYPNALQEGSKALEEYGIKMDELREREQFLRSQLMQPFSRDGAGMSEYGKGLQDELAGVLEEIENLKDEGTPAMKALAESFGLVVDKAEEAKEQFRQMKEELDFAIRFTASTDDAKKKIEDLKKDAEAARSDLEDLGATEYVSPDQIAQVETMRQAWNNAHYEYANLEKALKDGDLSPNKTAEAKERMEELGDVISELSTEAISMGMPKMFSEGWTQNVEEAIGKLGETQSAIGEVEAAYAKSTKEMMVNAIMQRAAQEMSKEGGEESGLALMALATQLAQNFDLAGSDAIQMFSDIQIGINNFLESEDAQAALDYFANLQSMANIRLSISVDPSITGGGPAGVVPGMVWNSKKKTYVANRASGGWLPEVTEVGEGAGGMGSEGIIKVAPDKYWVVPHDQWMEMKANGFANVPGLAKGGFVGGAPGGDDPYGGAGNPWAYKGAPLGTAPHIGNIRKETPGETKSRTGAYPWEGNAGRGGDDQGSSGMQLQSSAVSNSNAISAIASGNQQSQQQFQRQAAASAAQAEKNSQVTQEGLKEVVAAINKLPLNLAVEIAHELAVRI